jgi:hypothetical protein
MAVDPIERTRCAVYTRLAGSIRPLDSAEHPGALSEHRERRFFREPRLPKWTRAVPRPVRGDEDSE